MNNIEHNAKTIQFRPEITRNLQKKDKFLKNGMKNTQLMV